MPSYWIAYRDDGARHIYAHTEQSLLDRLEAIGEELIRYDNRVEVEYEEGEVTPLGIPGE